MSADESIWEQLGDPKAESMQLRSTLMMNISRTVKGWNLTQLEAANRLGVTQPRLNDLLTGKIDKFSLDALVLLLKPAGLKMTVEISSK